jgi:hypothetical protein
MTTMLSLKLALGDQRSFYDHDYYDAQHHPSENPPRDPPTMPQQVVVGQT